MPLWGGRREKRRKPGNPSEKEGGRREKRRRRGNLCGDSGSADCEPTGQIIRVTEGGFFLVNLYEGQRGRSEGQNIGPTPTLTACGYPLFEGRVGLRVKISCPSPHICESGRVGSDGAPPLWTGLDGTLCWMLILFIRGKKKRAVGTFIFCMLPSCLCGKEYYAAEGSYEQAQDEDWRGAFIGVAPFSLASNLLQMQILTRCYHLLLDLSSKQINSFIPNSKATSINECVWWSVFRACFFEWLKQFNHSHPPSTNFNQLQPLLLTTKFHCIPFSTHFNLLQPTSPIYHPLFTTERNSCVLHRCSSLTMMACVCPNPTILWAKTLFKSSRKIEI